MRYVAAYLLAGLGGNASPSAKDIKKILGSVGIEADEDRVDKVLEELNGKDINEIIASGRRSCSQCHLEAEGSCCRRAVAGARRSWRLRKQLRRQRNPRPNQKSLMMTWDSVFLTKRRRCASGVVCPCYSHRFQ
ncbi:PREDICTED: LOW QUALITY PROTEIN: 60S acidic ribosomal protein P2-like [Priapulus caudatus]|uniref:Large ribosomal subunit protein P2 n=1 Tax=Priapulus caudatus TaxID=37621 RepID=A0ABM1DVN9_PRICU|nr:PREDICTED: LOW QUALITY PROTEIN: 60S acidic ribosomal protein P2-like [Priapulus caudatus]